MAIKRIATGIPGLDNLIGGGFKEKSVNLVAGGPGTGKTIFALQFLLDGLKRGEAGIYITFEEKRRNIYEDVLEFGWDLEKYEKQGIPASFYIHSWELVPEYMPKIELPFKENFVTYHNINKAYNRMDELLKQFEFTSFSDYVSRGINFSN